MNHEPSPSAADDALNSFGGNPVPLPQANPVPGSDEKFQELLLGLAAKASERPDSGALIQFFCRATRE